MTPKTIFQKLMTNNRMTIGAGFLLMTKRIQATAFRVAIALKIVFGATVAHEAVFRTVRLLESATTAHEAAFGEAAVARVVGVPVVAPVAEVGMINMCG